VNSVGPYRLNRTGLGCRLRPHRFVILLGTVRATLRIMCGRYTRVTHGLQMGYKLRVAGRGCGYELWLGS